jgi:hypothetical protein
LIVNTALIRLRGALHCGLFRLTTGSDGVVARSSTEWIGDQMIRDLLIAVIIVVIAVVLGIAVHPLLLLLLVLAAIWLFSRRTAW